MNSNADKIYKKLCEVYPDAMQTLSELSFNTDGNKQFLISDEMGFNFDKVTNLAACHPKGRKEKSPDALFLSNGILYFIEFKEGSAKKDDIRMKIHEGINTLFCFTLKHLPEINREGFLSLKIRYAVVMRGFRATGRQGIIDGLEASSNKFNLRNLEGFLIDKTSIRDEPKRILDLLNIVSSGKIKSIEIDLPDMTRASYSL